MHCTSCSAHIEIVNMELRTDDAYVTSMAIAKGILETNACTSVSPRIWWNLCVEPCLWQWEVGSPNPNQSILKWKWPSRYLRCWYIIFRVTTPALRIAVSILWLHQANFATLKIRCCDNFQLYLKVAWFLVWWIRMTTFNIGKHGKYWWLLLVS